MSVSFWSKVSGLRKGLRNYDDLSFRLLLDGVYLRRSVVKAQLVAQ
jgi:hypothetical protein